MKKRNLFVEALQKEENERSAFLDIACANDAELRQHVDELLAAHRKEDSFFLDAPPPGVVATQVMPTITEKPGDKIGSYKIREQIGEGGFGVVYVAEQEEPVARKVALKIIKPGMDSKDVIARFGAERHTLALMDHPNIAKVLDAGMTDSGRPYFVMELIKGIPITEFCDEQKLSTRERLQLFVDLCRAVQHAHQKGIIHRDLKPSNIMVTLSDGRPVIKVIDFGVSKALSSKLTDNTVYTAFGQMIGTPLYMSPEQAEMSMNDVDTRSDVYSLGVLLYELMTGTTPFDKETLKKSGIDEMRRIIREVEPPRPSDRISTLKAEQLSTVSEKRKIDTRKISQSYKGELDWIVMKALEKDRNRRYESASAFAADVNRHLIDEPIEARPPSAVYRVRKFARRNRPLITTLLLVAASMLIGTAVSIWQAVEANNAREKAQENLTEADKQRIRAENALNETRTTIDKYVETIQNAKLLKEPRFKPLMKELLKDALAHYKRFVKDHGHDDSMLLDLSKAMFQIANISAGIGGSEEAIDAYQQVNEIRERLVRENPTVTEYQIELSNSYHNIARLYIRTGKADQSLAALQNALEIRKRLVRDNPRVPGFKHGMAGTLHNMANVHNMLGRPSKAEKLYCKALEISGKIVLEYPDRASYREFLANHELSLGNIYRVDGNSDQALVAYQKALKNQEQLVCENPTVTGYQFKLAGTHNNIGVLYNRTDKPVEAHVAHQNALQIRERLVRENPTVIEFQSNLAKSHGNIGLLYTQTDKLVEALVAFERALEIRKGLVRENPTVTEYQNDLARGHYGIGLLYEQTGKLAQALVAFQKALEIEDVLVRENPANSEYRYALMNSHNNIAWFLATTPNEQIRDPKKAIGHAEKAVELAPEDGNYRNTLGIAHYRADDMQSAIETLEMAIKLLSGGDPNNWLILAMAEWRLGNKDEAIKWYDMSVEWMKIRQTKDSEMIRFRAEAEKLLGIPILAPKPKSVKKQKPLVAPRPLFRKEKTRKSKKNSRKK